MLRRTTGPFAAALSAVILALALVVTPARAESLDIAGTCGTCSWEIDTDGLLSIRPTDGESGELDTDFCWQEYADQIVSVTVGPGVIATDLSDMFHGFDALAVADLSGLDTSDAADMSGMFFSCDVLRTVFVGDTWSTDNVTESTDMFAGCFLIAGGLGTTYDGDYVDATFARVDTDDAPGYFVAEGAEPVHEPGWSLEEEGYRYFELSGTMRVSDWVESDGSYYYMDETGAVVINSWLNLDGMWYYLGANGKLVRNGWVTYKGAYFYLNGRGNPVPNTWFKYKGSYYYLGTYGQLCRNGWVKYRGAYYYLGKTGKMATNAWVKSGGKYYYVGSSGRALSSRWISYKGSYYYLNSRGNPVTNGWVTYGGDYYYMGSNGTPLTCSWISYQGKSYYVDGSGKMLSDQWIQEYGTFYYLSSDGSWTDTRVYSASGPLANLIVACCTTPTTGANMCAAWVTSVFENAGIGSWGGAACEMYSTWCVSSDPAELKPGMIIAVKTTAGSTAAYYYGHVGIYVGDGLVAHNLSGKVSTMELNTWIASFGGSSTPRWGWFGGVVLY